MASRISCKVCTLGQPGALGTGRWGSIQDHSASDKSVWYALLMLGTLPSHLLKAPFRTVSEDEFCELRHNGVLGSSLSSGAARRRLHIRHEHPEDGIRDAPLEAPQRLLTGFALRHLLAVVGSAQSVRPGLTYRDQVQGVVELTVPR